MTVCGMIRLRNISVQTPSAAMYSPLRSAADMSCVNVYESGWILERFISSYTSVHPSQSPYLAYPPKSALKVYVVTIIVELRIASKTSFACAMSPARPAMVMMACINVASGRTSYFLIRFATALPSIQRRQLSNAVSVNENAKLVG